MGLLNPRWYPRRQGGVPVRIPELKALLGVWFSNYLLIHSQDSLGIHCQDSLAHENSYCAQNTIGFQMRNGAWAFCIVKSASGSLVEQFLTYFHSNFTAISLTGFTGQFYSPQDFWCNNSAPFSWLVPYLLDTGLACFGILKFVKLTTWQNAHGSLGHALATGPWEIRAGPGLNRYQKHPKRRRASNDSPAQPRLPTLPRATWTKLNDHPKPPTNAICPSVFFFFLGRSTISKKKKKIRSPISKSSYVCKGIGDMVLRI